MPAIQLHMRVEMRDGTVHEKVTADQGDVRLFEREFRMTFATALKESLFNLMAFTAWAALVREGRIKGMDWPAFDKACLEVTDAVSSDGESAGMDVGVDPTSRVPSAGA